MMIRLSLVALICLTATAAFGQAAQSLNSCQKTVAAASAKYVSAVANGVGTCLSKMSTQVVKKGRTTAEAADVAAAACVTAFAKMSGAKTLGTQFEATVRMKCDPAANPHLQHVEAATYTVGATTLGAADLSEYCATLGGDGTLDSFAEWLTCLHTAADGAARQAITLRWPRALEYFEALLPAIGALPVTSKRSAALGALAALDSEIEGPVEDNLPDPPPPPPGLLATGQTELCFSPDYCHGVPASDGRVRAGFAAQYGDNRNGTISDKVTGLTWEKLSDDGSIHDRSATYTFAAAFTTKIAALNAGSGFAGHTDWRLPNRRELESLVEVDRYYLTIAPIFDDSCAPGCSILECSCTLPEAYWSSTSYQPDASSRWVVEFFSGNVGPSTAASSHVRAVRGGTYGATPPAPVVPPLDGPAAASLDKCQKTVAAQSTKYIRAVTHSAGKCLSAISTKVIKKGASTAEAVNKSAVACTGVLRKLVNTDAPAKQLGERFDARVAAKCDPAVNPLLAHLDVQTYAIGNRTLAAGTLGKYCARYGGDGTIDGFGEWSSCVHQAADAEVLQAIALRWPRALEYFAALKTELLALPASAKQTDALAALAALDLGLEGSIDDNKPEPPPGPAAGLLQTGQTQCVQNDLSMGACPGGLPGQDGEVRAGLARSYTDNGDGTITDHITGLMWEKLSTDGSIHDHRHQYLARFGAFLNKIPRLNRNSFAGYSDWRLPNRRELESLVDAGRAMPAIDPIFNHDCTLGCTELDCSCTGSLSFTTSTSTVRPSVEELPFASNSYWGVDFGDGSVDSGGSHVRAVRGGQLAGAHVDSTPIAHDVDVKHTWLSPCVPYTVTATDFDDIFLFIRFVTYPQNGFLTAFVTAPIPAALPDHYVYYGPTDATENDFVPLVPHPGGLLQATVCYVTFSTTFIGTDSFLYYVIDPEGHSSNVAIATITIFEN